MHGRDELRRIERLDVCCRVEVRERSSVWTAVTEDLCDRGCRLVTAKAPRLGSVLDVTLTSDLFPEALQVSASVVWATSSRVGIAFVRAADDSPTPAEWIDRVLHHGRVEAPGAHAVGAPRVVPVVQRPARNRAGVHEDVRGPVVVPFRARRR